MHACMNQNTDFLFTIVKKPYIENRCLEKKMADYVDKGLKRIGITISKPMLAIICIIFGLTVIIFPNLLVWIVGLFLVIQGALLLTDIFEHERAGTTAAIPRGVYCPQCGTRNIEEAVFCKKCGENLKQGGQKKSRS
jgi:hypothetical protein